MYLLPAPKVKTFTVLGVDFIKDRLDTLRLAGEGKPYSMRLVYSDAEVLAAIYNPPGGQWDVVFTSTSLTGVTVSSALDLVPLYIKAWKEKLLRAVIVISSLEPESPNMIAKLRKAGVPSAWYPYNYNSPSTHIRKEDIQGSKINVH